MTRGLSSSLQSQIALDQNKIAFLIEINFSTPVRFTNHYADVTYDSNTYQAGSDFVDIDTANETGEAKVESIVINMTNVSSTIRNLVEGGNYTSTSVNVYLAFFDSNESLVDAVNYFSGFISNCNATDGYEVSSVSIEVANIFANWNLKKGTHFSDESQQSIFSGDKGLEYADQVKADIRWGS
jgi:hypothetical protein|tara:strand:- start:490 stop:1038 length:549 start_codon:yes stop_codon:yes gene_type:complete